MPTINQLSTTTPAASDQVAIYSSANGDARKASFTSVATLMQGLLTFPSTGFPQYTTQYAAPSATGFNVAVTGSGVNVWLILTPTAGYADGTITLPAVATVVDKQEILVNCTQQVTTLTFSANGASAVTGEPATLAADSFFRLRYDAATSTWYRVG